MAGPGGGESGVERPRNETERVEVASVVASRKVRIPNKKIMDARNTYSCAARRGGIVYRNLLFLK